MLSENLLRFVAKFRHAVVDGLSSEQAADAALDFVREKFLEESKQPTIAAKEEEWKPVAAILDAFRIGLIGLPVYRGPLKGIDIAWDATRFTECFKGSDPTRNPDDPHPIPETLKDK